MAVEVGERRILRLVVALDRSQLQVVRGVRNAVGAVGVLLAGLLTGHVAAGVEMASGALLVGFVDIGASYASRARVMLIGTALVGVSTLVGALTGGVDWLTVLLMGIWGFAAGLSACLGLAPSFLGVLAALSLLLSAYYPDGLGESLQRAGLTMLGALVQTALALAVWPLRPFRPEREALASAYRAIAAFVDAMAAGAATGWTHGRETGSRLRPAVRRRRALVAHSPLSVLHANLSLRSTALRHGVRLGATLAVATALYRVLDLPRGYWVPLTVAFVLRPDFGSTFSRGVQRYAGTILGAVLATAITALLDPGHATLVVLVAAFTVGIYALLFASYLLFTASMTALVVFLVAFDGVSEWTAVTDRLLDTAIGGALTLAAYRLWPTWEGERVSGRLADLIDANRSYVRAVLSACIDPARHDADAPHEARPGGRRARTEAEASVQLAQAEPQKHRGDIDTDLDILASLRRLADGTLALEAGLEDAPARTERPALRPPPHDPPGALAELAAVERNGGRAPRLPALRAEHDALAASEPADSPIAFETDRMVNAVDTLGHLLTPARLGGRPGAPSAPASPTVGARS